MELKIQILENEVWYGPSSIHGSRMPFDRNTAGYWADLETAGSCNQDNPMMISSRGRGFYAEKGFTVSVNDGEISVSSKFGDIYFDDNGGDLKGIYSIMCKKFFSPSGVIPPEEFFTIPQYNTWIELMYDQNQADVLRYAHGIKDSGMPAGIIMIDDGWNDYYGSFEFAVTKFPDPKAMCDELHSMGFKVMMWICPFISPDSREYRYLEAHDMMVRTSGQKGALNPDALVPAIRQWWNGWSAELDLTNPETVRWLDEKLEHLKKDYGVDGFKLDAGDAVYYKEDDATFEKATPAEQAMKWNEYGLRHPYNEFRACFRCAGQALVQRLHDKEHSWENGVKKIIPDTIAQGLLGYAYTCPDMIGGGSWVDFLPGSKTFDPELLVRYCEASALMPMMQFSLAPWRVLSEEHFAIILKMSRLHEEFAPYIIQLAKEASVTGMPIVRHLDIVFPGEGFERTVDCYMLGDDILVCPVYEKGALTKTVRLPEGRWQADDGKVYDGGCTVTVDAPLDRLPYFRAI